MGRTRYIVAAGIAAAAVIGVLVLFNPMARTVGFPDLAADNATNVASEQPMLELVLLENAEDSSRAVERYLPENNETISLSGDAHIRFESPELRPPDSLRVVAHDTEDGSILILRKSYDVNNEFFVNLGQGKYELRAEATWADDGHFLYTYDITVV